MLEISDRLSAGHASEKKYPRVYLAEGIRDMEGFRTKEAEGLEKRVGIIPSASYGDSPWLVSRECTAIIYLPEVQHNPGRDPQVHRTRLFGLLSQTEFGVSISDRWGQINAWYDSHSFLNFPYATCFDDIDALGNTWFSKDEWKARREATWRKPVVVLAQYTQPHNFKEIKKKVADSAYQPPISSLYWLIHIFDSKRNGRIRTAERVVATKLPPIPVLG